jgi:hypothetical protein
MAEHPQIQGERVRSLEDEFFRKEDQRAIERLREMKDKAVTRDALGKAAGITDEAVLDRLIALGVRPEVASALAIVPLIEVAWADGSLDAKERQLVLERAEQVGIAAGSAAHDLLRGWLERKPEAALLTAWMEMVRGLTERMGPQEIASLRSQLVERAQAIARASGGFMGVGATSAAERDMIERLGSAFGVAQRRAGA